ncbi:amidohydrolase family protein [Kribbella capetownensis]|uniref:amidohydrolase family protein n=1 Tax=Kribbella capetownensis TaxID=1572659 RepID=UPI0013F42457|nr:amidohydrolase family protein [Kribbella capetownensis]
MSTLIKQVRVFDGVDVLDADCVLVQGDRIVKLGRDLSAPAGCVVVDGAGGMLLPGFIDAHVHTPDQGTRDEGISALRQALQLGVTTMLCMGCRYPDFVAHLKALQQPDLADLRSAGIAASVEGSHPTQLFDYYPTLNGVEDVAPFVHTRVSEGSDYLKIVIEDSSVIGKSTPFLPPEVSAAVTAKAHSHGLLVVAHAQSRRFVAQAIESGVDGLAHQYVDQPLTPEFARFLKSAGVFVVMTLAVYHSHEGVELANDPRVRPHIDSRWMDILCSSVGGQEQFQEYGLAAVRPLRDAGVPILAGSDANNPGTTYGASLHHELDLLVRGGLTRTEALTAATAAPAKHFRLPDRGRIAPGLRADLILVEGDPTVDIDATKSIARVWRSGVAGRGAAPAAGGDVLIQRALDVGVSIPP